MADRLHLSERHQRILEALLREHLLGVEVRAYGSLVNGRSHGGSDLGLVLRSPDQVTGYEGRKRTGRCVRRLGLLPVFTVLMGISNRF